MRLEPECRSVKYLAVTEGLPDTKMPDEAFCRLSQLIHRECGIHLPLTKKALLEGRLRKRLRKLDMKSFEDYCDLLLSPEGRRSELFSMIDAVTTNKTDFLREGHQFEYLTNVVLCEWMKENGSTPGRKLKAWSSACSSGEEPYTLAMVLAEYAAQHPMMFHFSTISATDISTRVLEKARLGIYEHEKIKPLPMAWRRKYLLKSKDPEMKLVKIAPEIRCLVDFRRLNLMDDDYGIAEPIDVVFCRNVMIYFDRSGQERVIRKIYEHMAPGGYLFMGHAETLNHMEVPFVMEAPSIYRKPHDKV